MTLNRRALLTAGAGLGLTAGARADAGTRTRDVHALTPGAALNTASNAALEPDSLEDQTATLQAAINEAARLGKPLHLPAGTLRTGPIKLVTGSKLIGAQGLSILQFTGGENFVCANDAASITIADVVFDGAMLALDPDHAGGLLTFENCNDVQLTGVDVRHALGNGIWLEGCSGRVASCTITTAAQGLFSNNARGLEISHNHVNHCTDNGILIWRDKAGDDGTTVVANRIEHIGAQSGGSGEYGNGINVFRADGVLIGDNRISDCTYSAVRGNSASNIQIVSNSCARLGEVAIYAEFAFEGAIISNNIVDTAATGISVTNFNEGGRLAIVQGNLIRNLFRREKEPADKRGEGITVEADTLVSGNVIENAPTCGISVGWGGYMRDCMVTQNLIRAARAGILISSGSKSGKVMITGNMISGAKDGAIRMMTLGIAEGPDLAQAGTATSARISISGNTTV